MVVPGGLKFVMSEVTLYGSYSFTHGSQAPEECRRHDRDWDAQIPANNVSGDVPRGEKMLYSRTDPESYISECASVHEDKYYCATRTDHIPAHMDIRHPRNIAATM